MTKEGFPLNVTLVRTTELSVTYRTFEMLWISKLNDVVSQNTTIRNDLISQWDTSDTSAHLIFGFLLSAFFVIGIIENIIVFFVFCKNNHIRNVINTYIIGLIIGDMGQLLFNIPLAIVSNIHGRWLFGDTVCQYYGFIVTGLGISQIALLSVISLERYFIFIKQTKTRNRTFAEAILFIIMCYVYGSLCAIGPVLGWSRYDVELYGTTCSIRWDNRSRSALTYVICLFTFGLFLPLVVIICSYTNIAYIIHTRKSTALNSVIIKNVSKWRSKELQVTLTILIMIGSFLFSWLPYAIVSFYTSIHGSGGIPHILFMVPPIIAKSAIIWNPLIYVLRNRQFRKSLFKSLRTIFRRCHGNCNRVRKQYVTYTNASTEKQAKQPSFDGDVLPMKECNKCGTGDNPVDPALRTSTYDKTHAEWHIGGNEERLKQESNSLELS